MTTTTESPPAPEFMQFDCLPITARAEYEQLLGKLIGRPVRVHQVSRATAPGLLIHFNFPIESGWMGNLTCTLTGVSPERVYGLITTKELASSDEFWSFMQRYKRPVGGPTKP